MLKSLLFLQIQDRPLHKKKKGCNHHLVSNYILKSYHARFGSTYNNKTVITYYWAIGELQIPPVTFVPIEITFLSHVRTSLKDRASPSLVQRGNAGWLRIKPAAFYPKVFISQTQTVFCGKILCSSIDLWQPWWANSEPVLPPMSA